MNPQFIHLLKAFVIGPLLFGTSQQQGQLSQDEKDLIAFIGIGTTIFGIVGYFQTYGTLPDEKLVAEPGEIIDIEAEEITPDMEAAETAPQWPEWITPGYWWQ